MSVAAETPIATDETEQLADWIECQALLSEVAQCSRMSLAKALGRTGTPEEVDDDPDDGVPPGASDANSQAARQVADDAFGEIENRVFACGAAYPFEVDQVGIRLKQIDATDSDYIFLLLLSKLGPTGGHDGTAVLFEHLCAHAAHIYLGGAGNTAKSHRVGAPRRPPLAMMRASVDELCARLGEGGGCRPEKTKTHNLGDGQLDVVAWREFSDDRVGKLIAFGQCAAGQSGWEDKLTEFDSLNFSKIWLRDSFVVDPIRLFFVPWRVSQKVWRDTSIAAGIVFDRSRIVGCLGGLGPILTKQRKTATAALMKQAVETPSFARTRSRHGARIRTRTRKTSTGGR